MFLDLAEEMGPRETKGQWEHLEKKDPRALWVPKETKVLLVDRGRQELKGLRVTKENRAPLVQFLIKETGNNVRGRL